MSRHAVPKAPLVVVKRNLRRVGTDRLGHGFLRIPGWRLGDHRLVEGSLDGLRHRGRDRRDLLVRPAAQVSRGGIDRFGSRAHARAYASHARVCARCHSNPPKVLNCFSQSGLGQVCSVSVTPNRLHWRDIKLSWSPCRDGVARRRTLHAVARENKVESVET